MADRKLYFAYGSNINLNQMAYRCPNAKVIGPVMLENYALLFRSSGIATIAPREGETVHGLLWQITPECERSLDRYEGYPRLYGKQPVTVQDSQGQKFTVMAYIMAERYRTPALPSTGYYNGILEGYHQNGLPASALKQAWNHAVQEVHGATEYINSGYKKDKLERPVETLKVLVVEPMKPCEIREIPDSLEVMQEIVGGRIESSAPFLDSVAIICNEEGKILGLPFNRPLFGENGVPYDILCGTFFVAGVDGDKLVSLTAEQQRRYKKMYDNMMVFTAEREPPKPSEKKKAKGTKHER